MPNPNEVLAPILKFQGKKAELRLNAAQTKAAKKVLGQNFEASEAICVFNFIELVKGAGKGQEVETAHMENLYEYCSLDAVQEGFEAGRLLPFAVLNILGNCYPGRDRLNPRTYYRESIDRLHSRATPLTPKEMAALHMRRSENSS